MLSLQAIIGLILAALAKLVIPGRATSHRALPYRGSRSFHRAFVDRVLKGYGGCCPL
jgi:hypothetical protein